MQPNAVEANNQPNQSSVRLMLPRIAYKFPTYFHLCEIRLDLPSFISPNPIALL